MFIYKSYFQFKQILTRILRIVQKHDVKEMIKKVWQNSVRFGLNVRNVQKTEKSLQHNHYFWVKICISKFWRVMHLKSNKNNKEISICIFLSIKINTMFAYFNSLQHFIYWYFFNDLLTYLNFSSFETRTCRNSQ